MKRFLFAILALALTLAIAGCGGGGGATGGGSTGGSTSGSSDAIASPEDLLATLERDYADAEWIGDVTGVTLETYLGAPVAVVHVAWVSTDPDFETRNRKQTALNNATAGYELAFAPNLAALTADGALMKMSSSGVGDYAPMETVFTLPAAPTDAAGFKAWLASVYGPGGLVTLGPDETWYAAIDSIEMEDGALTAETKLTKNDLLQRELLNLAMQTSGSPLLANYAIKGADGSFLGGVAGSGTPGINGFFYKKQ